MPLAALNSPAAVLARIGKPPSPRSEAAFYPHEVTLLFEDVALHEEGHSAFSWRVTVPYRTPEDWIVQTIELPTTYACQAFTPLARRHLLWVPLMTRSNEDDLAEMIVARIMEDMEERRPARVRS